MDKERRRVMGHGGWWVVRVSIALNDKEVE